MDKNFIKSSLKVLVDYLITVLIFGVFLYVFISITKENFYTWLPLYSVFIFLLMFLIIYSDMKGLAKKEKRPQYDLNPYPLKGFLYGLLGFAPFIVIEVIVFLTKLQDPALDRIKELGMKALLGPLYFAANPLGGNLPGYLAASLIVPLTAMLGYLAGYYGFELKKITGGKKEALQEEQKFEKSPWNPAVSNPNPKKKKNKKKKTV